MVKALFKKVLHSLGYDLVEAHRAPSRQSIKEAMRQLAQLGYSPSTVIDVGAASGTLELLEVFPESRYLWIEPLREFEDSLKRLTKKYTGKYILSACGRQQGLVPFHVHPYLEGSSILNESEGAASDGDTRQVPICRLDEVCNADKVRGETLLKVDVQGAELDVLEGAGRFLDLFEVVVLEVSLFRFMVTNPEVCDVIVYMKGKGFVAYDIVGGKTRLLDGALAQVDIVFVKENGRFRQSHHWATPEQRREYIAANADRGVF